MDELACEEVTVAAGDPDPRETGDDENHVSLWGGFDPPPSWVVGEQEGYMTYYTDERECRNLREVWPRLCQPSSIC